METRAVYKEAATKQVSSEVFRTKTRHNLAEICSYNNLCCCCVVSFYSRCSPLCVLVYYYMCSTWTITLWYMHCVGLYSKIYFLFYLVFYTTNNVFYLLTNNYYYHPPPSPRFYLWPILEINSARPIIHGSIYYHHKLNWPRQ